MEKPQDGARRRVADGGVGAAAIVALGLGAFHVLSRDAAVSAALAVTLVELTLWGYVAGRRMGAGIPGAVSAALVNVVLGGLIVALKSLFH